MRKFTFPLPKLTYLLVSSSLKIIIIPIGAYAVYLATQSDSAKLTAMFLGGVCTLIGIFLGVIDIFHKEQDVKLKNIENLIISCQRELESNFSALDLRLKRNFEYNGLLNMPKVRFTPAEMRDMWPKLMRSVHKDFLAINYLSPEEWNRCLGPLLVEYLGTSTLFENITAKRILLIDSENEKHLWKNTVELHLKYQIPIMMIMKSDFNRIRDEMAIDDQLIKNVNGFNIIDHSDPGIVFDWHYKDNRSMDCGFLYPGTTTAERYLKLFNAIWKFGVQRQLVLTNSNQCNSFVNFIGENVTEPIE
jgi:hypothetical protein